MLELPSATNSGAIGISAWVDAHAFAMLLAALMSLGIGNGLPIAAVAGASFTLYAWKCGETARGRPFGGWPNFITAVRLAVVIVVAASMGWLPRELVLSAFAANVALDVADGYVARLQRQSTAFGAVLDREADACFVLVACAYFHLAENIGLWILVPGLLPYAYRLIVTRRRAAPARERKEKLATWLAGLNFGLLLTAVALQGTFRTGVLVVSSAVVVLSFASSLLRHCRDEHPVP